MTRAGDGQELGDAFDDPEDQGLQQVYPSPLIVTVSAFRPGTEKLLSRPIGGHGEA
ncbi:hypothetical protein [Leifsonia sp. SIMBA_070]|uniref:hypothetical protein n=1 Tax=Leifsonia sp. SIMBA_070 TaxID=3085810 RepID=UPI00397E2096